MTINFQQQKGKLIVFSGIDRAGKTTQRDRIRSFLDKSNIQHRYIWIRGGYTSGFEKIKMILRGNKKKSICPPGGSNLVRSNTLSKSIVRKLWLFSAIIDLIRLGKFEIPHLLRNGSTIICDRYLLDTLIDFKTNFPLENFEDWLLWKILVRVTPVPDISFLLQITVDESIRRSGNKGEPFCESREILTSRFNFYQSLGQAYSCHVVNGLETADQIADEIIQTVKSKIFA